ncbi:MAG: bestrophin family protein [Pseudanabaenaceae cyanobacterium]|jgi:putative membrane protein
MQENVHWLQTALQLKGSVIRITYPRILCFMGLAVGIAWLNGKHFINHDLEITLSSLPTNVIYNLVLGLLLVFRTNAAYDRFWEGRKAWGSLIINLRILAREITLHHHFKSQIKDQIQDQTQDQTEEQTDRAVNLPNQSLVITWLKLIAISTKHHLRSESLVEHITDSSNNIPIGSDLKDLGLNLDELGKCPHPPLQITLWLSQYCHQQHQANYIDTTRLTQLQSYLDQLITGITCCERIRDTPLPVAYTILLRRLTLLYCGLIPFSLVENLSYWTVLVTGLIAFVLLGVEALAAEIENPFGYDDNDLALDDFCRNVSTNIDQITQTNLNHSISN